MSPVCCPVAFVFSSYADEPHPNLLYVVMVSAWDDEDEGHEQAQVMTGR
jgi:hypothetical protein